MDSPERAKILRCAGSPEQGVNVRIVEVTDDLLSTVDAADFEIPVSMPRSRYSEFPITGIAPNECDGIVSIHQSSRDSTPLCNATQPFRIIPRGFDFYDRVRVSRRPRGETDH